MKVFSPKDYFDLHFKNDRRKCEVCGCCESYDNIILSYADRDNFSHFLCDDCLCTFGDLIL